MDLVREFPSKGWNVDRVYKLLQKLQIAGSVGHCPGSGRRCSNRTADTLICLRIGISQVTKPEIIFAHCT